MKAQLFLDSIRILVSNFQAQTLKLITTTSPLSHKIEDLSLNLLTLKSNLFKTLQTILRQPQIPILADKIQKQYDQSSKKLKKLELHAFLKKKLRKIQKQSIMHSIAEQSFDSSFVEDPVVGKLRNSMLLIERDLGIDNLGEEEDQGYAYGRGDVSGVVQRSMASLEMTPIKTDRSQVSDTSMRFEDSYILPENKEVNVVKRQKQKQSSKEQQRVKTQAKSAATTNARKKKPVPQLKASIGKGGMFDNLLEESVNICFSETHKM